MPSTREIRRRIRSVRNMSQVTKAMEMVAASRMRRAQQRVLASRPYADLMREMMADLAAQPLGAEPLHPLLVRRPVRNVGLVVVSPNRGLCGSLPANLMRTVATYMLQHKETPTRSIAVGRKGRDWLARYARNLDAEFTGLGDQPSYMETTPIARVVIDEYERGDVDEVYLVYTRFINTLNQRPEMRKLLPVEPGENANRLEYIYEPSPGAVLSELLPRYVEVQIYQTILEAIASEQSARMVAMRNATDNAKDLVKELTLTYNKVRQANITREVAEISAGAAALTG